MCSFNLQPYDKPMFVLQVRLCLSQQTTAVTSTPRVPSDNEIHPPYEVEHHVSLSHLFIALVSTYNSWLESEPNEVGS